MNDSLVQARLTALLQACTDGPWESRLPWDDAGFASRFVNATDDNSGGLGPPEPAVSRILEIWDLSKRGDGNAPPSVLDLACGSGRHAIALAWVGCDVIGVDIAGPAIDRALENASGRRNGDIGFVEADIANYDPGRKFDLIQLLSVQCAHFSAAELAGIIRRYLEFLTVDGLLVLELPGKLPEPGLSYRKPEAHAPLFSDRPYSEMQLTEVDSATRLVSDRYAVLTEEEDRVTVYTNWRLFYPAEWIAQMLPSAASMRVDHRRSRPDWCVISCLKQPVVEASR